MIFYFLAGFFLQLLVSPHRLLVSLLLLNSGAFEALPIFLDRLLNPVAAILISVTAILIFGEILPQAVCKRYGLQIGAYLSWLVWIVICITFPISYPLGKCLDWLLGEETVLFRRAELRELVTLHAEPDEDGGESMLTAEEVQVIHGALDMAHKTAETAMTSLANVFAVEADAPLDRKLLERIIGAGHSRIPVYEHGEKRNIIGLILVKELILLDQSKKMKIRNCLLRDVDFIVADTPLYSVMELFRLKRRHMAVLTRGLEGSVHSVQGGATVLEMAEHTEKVARSSMGATNTGAFDVVGVITIEDVIEELLNVEIIDETDVYIDNEQTEKVVPHSGKELPPKLSKYLSIGLKKRTTLGKASPSKPQGQKAVIAAAAGAAYAAAKTQQGGKGGGVAPHRRIQSELALPVTKEEEEVDKETKGPGKKDSGSPRKDGRPGSSML